MHYKRFYSELGKLLYAVAEIDGTISQKEKKSLQDIIKKELVPSETHTDEFGTDVAYYAEIEFDFLADKKIHDTEWAFDSFIDYVDEHRTAFDEKMKKVSLKLVKKLAAAYQGTNNKEKALIEKLKQKLDEIEVKKEKVKSE